MPSLKDIKRKVSAVQKTKQITRAMNMVAAAKFKSAQLKMENFRPYAGKFMDVLNSLAPVSYTHLRAHETPEHLVCRLLLENKNSPTHYPQRA